MTPTPQPLSSANGCEGFSEDHFSLWLAAGDEALAAGNADTLSYAADAPTNLRPRLER